MTTAMRAQCGPTCLASTGRPLQSRAFKACHRPVRSTRAQASQGSPDSSLPAAPAAPLLGASAAALLLLDAPPAQAIGREYGVMEGTIASLTHPAVMFFLFGASVYAGYLGFQVSHSQRLLRLRWKEGRRAPTSSEWGLFSS